MRLCHLTLAIATVAITVPALGQDAPQLAPSGRGTSTVSEMVEGDATPRIIRLDWGQPHLRGRALHTDSLVPFGQVWRTGANDITTLHSDFDLMLGTTHLPAGDYAIFTLPSPDGWQLIVQRETGPTAANYDASQDLARIPLRQRTLATPLESLTMWLVPDRDAARGQLRLAWGTTELATDWSVM